MDAEVDCLGSDEIEIWLQSSLDHDLPCVNDASMVYADFPPLPDFPCMASSSSSSSSTSAPVMTATCSFSWPSPSLAVLKSDDAVDAPPLDLSSTASLEIPQLINGSHSVPNDCTTDVMATFGMDHQYQETNIDFFSPTTSPEIPQLANHSLPNGGSATDNYDIDVMDNTFGYMDQLESKDFFDLASILQNLENPLEDFPQQLPQQEEHAHQQPQEGTEEEDHLLIMGTNNDEESIQEGGEPDDEMLNVFLEWFKSNKDGELGSGKLKNGTIECVARRLGGGKDAMKQLLKLIFEWVQTSHLLNERCRKSTSTSNLSSQIQDPCQIQNPRSYGTSFNNTQWISAEAPPMTAPAATIAGPNLPPALVGCVGDPTGAGNIFNEYPLGSDFHRHSWPYSEFGVGSHYNQQFPDNEPATYAAGYCNQNPFQHFRGPVDRMMRLDPSETREARKKRRARQRRYLAHDRQQDQNYSTHPSTSLGSDNGTVAMASYANPINPLYWNSVACGDATEGVVIPAEAPFQQQAVDPMAMQRINRQVRQGWKTKRDVRFLMRKVLKQSDVGNLRRIVLPKKEAENHLPELNEARNGVSIAVEEIGTSRVWNMRYRYWPNNNSRMYLLENTGEFVRVNGLKKGDSILLYSDIKSGKYMIRGMKARQSREKEESKKSGKSHNNKQGNAATTSTTAGDHNAAESSTFPINTKLQKNEKASE